MLRLSRVPGAVNNLRVAAAEDGAFLNLPGALRYFLIIALVGSAYFIGGRLGLALAFSTKQVSAVWPPAGIALAALVVCGNRAWPGVFLAALLINASNREPILVACCIAVGNTAAAFIGATALRALRFDAALERSGDVASFLAVAICSTLVSSTVGSTALVAGGIVPAADHSSVWWIEWTGDALGALIAAPVILTWLSRPRPRPAPAVLIELVAYVAVTIIIGVAVFVLPSEGGPFFHPKAYCAFPLLVWAGLRLGSRETALGVAIIATLAVWGSFHGLGPFSRWGPDSRFILLDAFLATLGCTALLIAAVTAERQGSQIELYRAQARLRDSYEKLEVRVRERTADLAAAVDELGRRNQEKETLLREIHHRVKNNLQVVCSLLNLQAQGHDEPGLVAFASDCLARVRSMALVHEHLYHSTELHGVPFAMYVGALVQEVVHAQRVSGNVEVDLDIRDDIALPVDQAIPCGLLINELLTNALKHAFPDGRAGRVTLSVGRVEPALIELLVSDDGIGMAETTSGAERCGFGLTLATMLVDQLGAVLQIERQPGTRVRVRFAPRIEKVLTHTAPVT